MMDIRLFKKSFAIEAIRSEQQSAVRTDSGTTYWLVLAKACDRAVVCHFIHSVYSEDITGDVREEQSNSEYD